MHDADQFDTFDNPRHDPKVCMDWGYALSGGTDEKDVNGALVLKPVAPNTNLGCVSAIPFAFTSSGTFAEITAVGTGTGQYNGIEVFWTTAKDDMSAISISAGTIGFQSHGQSIVERPYTADRDRWVRLRPSADRTFTIAETSTDGHAWAELGHDAVAPQAMIEVQLQSGLPANGAGATEMHVASFDVCP